MTIATHDDILKVFPGLQDHTVTEILAAKATINELEAALVVLTGNDEELIEMKQQEGGQLHRLLSILNQSEIQLREDRDV